MFSTCTRRLGTLQGRTKRLIPVTILEYLKLYTSFPNSLMVFIKHLSSSMCLSVGTNGNHQLRWAKFWRAKQRKLISNELSPFLREVSEYSVLVKQVPGGGLWLRCSGACLPVNSCLGQRAAVTTNSGCDRGLTLQPLLRIRCVSNSLCICRAHEEEILVF